ncbi:MAG: FlgD immunoglobulin-like domain containing protein [Candidatus Cloacimonetes bacterium]|nr:FlgD immunoglobulin-like domain containing protein [Candidatus Cloacimonadota bacterium]
MKRWIILITLISSILLLDAELQKNADLPRIAEVETAYRINPIQRNVPVWNWGQTPVSIATNFYDYFPGSSYSFPVRIQPLESENGVYIAFQAIENSTSQRRIYYAYISPDGEITSSPVTSLDFREGFPGIAVDQDTGAAVYVWHAQVNESPNLKVLLSVDQFDIFGVPGHITEPIVLWDNPGQDEFIWPSVFIGHSPSYDIDGSRRIYVFGSKPLNTSCDDSMQAKISYRDFSSPSDLAIYNEDDWTTFTIAQFEQWISIYVHFTINCSEDGKIIIVGHMNNGSSSALPFDPMDRLFVIENHNFGEGEWFTHVYDGTLPVTNPDDYFLNENGIPYQDMRFTPLSNSHNNVLIDNQGNIQFTLLYTLFNEEESWYPLFTTAKKIKYYSTEDPSEEGNWEIQCLYPPDAVEDDNEPYLPWNHDGLGINYIGDNLITYPSWPVGWYETNDVFYEQYFRMSQNDNWIAVAFSEGTKAKLYDESSDEYYYPWAYVPEFYIFLSEDYGDTWYDPIKLNAIETLELDGMVPAYFYLSDKIEKISDTQGKLHLMFTDDNSYGSSIHGNGINNGSTIMYASIIVDFTTGTSNQTSALTENAVSNYPNPFNMSGSERNSRTTIQFSVEQPGNVKVTVHNIKGQLVKTLTDGFMPAGEKHSVEWNGTDEAGNAVSSGVYLYKVETVQSAKMNKMLLIK